LQDIDNNLRLNILNWQNDLRSVAKRLTKKFQLKGYSTEDFFFEFFEVADQRLMHFLQNEHYSGQIDKLLNGIVFELAAECPLDWRK